ncbi:cytochrome-c oxidase, cbb3-type subunit III [Alcaligenes ammonioxydans]|jgi:cytochrome c oxidase cbb3-type subunit 3|uniref:Cbb3-type cytochrome c oxidase subunit n=1 Tax=Alcaligenes ammonioxydans TaxID=2582914 RepID=A0ABX8T067_9BURK|nr:cytochrome-c oxidase, cbb3-type subunit III [Alcaligenes ammonioxydans]QBH18340.1 cytochrome-c oxidase, cbb3-type subunit III [Alcaligenes faecalis]MCH1878112.1 cytochrome-c oxidase, cbb3-type subunit III [Alcaligenes ammonioxydans]QXX79494.1 cytochrome-c oxidase, cbb3-type subunit III [Alcaligenes ammonioxydans]WGQ34421.1 cytochrome-c oxidase, cbb3-type subunit III [Alcaligenes faecalis]HRK87146.1 cytochrome-c oxidase, cbb3-type subunit III [Alcaligenes faecalis]
MSDFFNNGWSLWISGIALLGIIFCLWLLFTQRAFLGKTVDVEETGHVWDGDLTELNTPVPRWWTVMYIGLCVFALGYLVLYPGLGSFKGTLGFTAGQQVKQQQAEINARLEPVYARYRDMPIEEIARDQEAREIGQRLFLNNCAQCHGSDAQGSPSFPNLANKAWLWGGEPEQILHTITEGRTGMMPPQAQFTPAEASDVAQYVRSLSGLAADPLRLVAGKRVYDSACFACHGADGKGNTLLGAPDLTDDYWLYGSSEATIVQTVLQGRTNQMPAQKGTLTPEQIRLLAGWVWGLSNNAEPAQAN